MNKRKLGGHKSHGKVYNASTGWGILVSVGPSVETTSTSMITPSPQNKAQCSLPYSLECSNNRNRRSRSWNRKTRTYRRTRINRTNRMIRTKNNRSRRNMSRSNRSRRNTSRISRKGTGPEGGGTGETETGVYGV